METKKKVILDTDMGVDCDDAVALALLLNKHRAGEIELLCVTASSTREGATATVKAINDYYGVELPIGAMALPAIPCDAMNNYGKKVKEKYHVEDSDVDAVALLRKTLSQQEEKVTLIVIGPQTNMARLMKSSPDEYSSLNGQDLIKEKVEEIYCMGGSFIQNLDFLLREKISSKISAEWNIVQDIPSAQYFVSHCNVPCTWIGWELGNNVLTRMGEGENPVWACMLFYAQSERYTYVSHFDRMSWDPITCICATQEYTEYLTPSKKGNMTVLDNGVTEFTEADKGLHTVLLLKEGFRNLEKLINGCIEPN